MAPVYKVGNKVYLSLWNIQINKPSKKLGNKATKFTVIEVISPSSYKLNTPLGIYNVFNVNLLRPAADDPLPSQVLDNPQPPVILVDDTEE